MIISEASIIPLLVGCVYILAETIKWLIRGRTSNKRHEDMAEFKVKVIERLDNMKIDLNADQKHYVDIIFTLKDIANTLHNVSQTQKELGFILKELERKLN